MSSVIVKHSDSDSENNNLTSGSNLSDNSSSKVDATSDKTKPPTDSGSSSDNENIQKKNDTKTTFVKKSTKTSKTKSLSGSASASDSDDLTTNIAKPKTIVVKKSTKTSKTKSLSGSASDSDDLTTNIAKPKPTIMKKSTKTSKTKSLSDSASASDSDDLTTNIAKSKPKPTIVKKFTKISKTQSLSDSASTSDSDDLMTNIAKPKTKQMVARPAIKAVTKPVAKSVPKPVAKLVVKPVAKLVVARPQTKPIARPLITKKIIKAATPESSDSESSDLESPNNTSKASRARSSDDERDTYNPTLSPVIEAMHKAFLQHMSIALEDTNFKDWMEENKITPSEFTKSIMFVELPKAKPASTIGYTKEQIMKWISSSFNDKWQGDKRHCIHYYVSRPPKGREKYTFCAEPGGSLCTSHKKAPVNKTLVNDLKNKGFSYNDYHNKCTTKRLKAAEAGANTYKIDIKSKVNSLKTKGERIDRSVSIDSSDSEESSNESSNESSSGSSSREEYQQYTHDKRFFYCSKDKLVLKKVDDNYRIVGIDTRDNGKKRDLSAAEVDKFNKQGIYTSKEGMKEDALRKDKLKPNYGSRRPINPTRKAGHK